MGGNVDPFAPVRWELVPGRTVLVLIDLQNDFLHPRGLVCAASGIDISHMRRVIEPTSGCSRRRAGRGVPVVWTRHGTASARGRRAVHASCARSSATAACGSGRGASSSTTSSTSAPRTGSSRRAGCRAFFNTNLETRPERRSTPRRCSSAACSRTSASPRLEGRDVPRLQADRRRGVHRNDAAHLHEPAIEMMRVGLGRGAEPRADVVELRASRAAARWRCTT